VALIENIPLNIKNSMRRAKKCSSPMPACQAWTSAGGAQNGHLPPPEIGTKKEKILEKVKSAL